MSTDHYMIPGQSYQYSYVKDQWTMTYEGLTFDVTANNYLLPLASEDFDVSPIRQARMKIWFKFEPSPKFDSLNTIQFWVDHFSQMTCRKLIAHHKALGIRIQSKTNKANLMVSLAIYWMTRIEELSKGIIS